MKRPRVIVLHTQPSSDPNVPVGAEGRSAGSAAISTFDEDDPRLHALRQQARIVEAPSFNVALIKPVDFPDDSVTTADDSVTAADRPSVSWGVEAVGALSSPFDGRGVTVAVLDTGVDHSHPAFAGVEIVEEDFTGDGNGDQNGHGTHCAGTICGRDVNGTRIGIARGVTRLLVGKVLGKYGGGSTQAIYDGMQWALKNGAHVISMSLGMDFPGYQKALVDGGVPEEVATSKALEGYRDNIRLFDDTAKLIRDGKLLGRHALVVAATGNESRREISSAFTIAKGPPAAADGFLSVGAIQSTNTPEKPFKVTPFSNTKADVAAPGVEIWSAWPGGGLKALSGTSMATPHVAGVAALWIEKSMSENDGDVVLGDVLDNLRYHARMTAGLKEKTWAKA